MVKKDYTRLFDAVNNLRLVGLDGMFEHYSTELKLIMSYAGSNGLVDQDLCLHLGQIGKNKKKGVNVPVVPTLRLVQDSLDILESEDLSLESELDKYSDVFYEKLENCLRSDVEIDPKIAAQYKAWVETEDAKVKEVVGDGGFPYGTNSSSSIAEFIDGINARMLREIQNSPSPSDFLDLYLSCD